jgi:tetratricopeptide (TPR) repeat protein
VSTLRAAAERANRRGAPESAAVFLRRALLEPPGSRALTADVHSELGLCLAAQVRPGAAAFLADAVELAATPEQRVRIALSGSQALGMAGHFDRAVDLCRLGLDQPVDAGAQLRGSLELEMACNMFLIADTVDEALDLARGHAVFDGDDDLWRVMAAWALLNDGGRVAEVNHLLLPALDAVTPPRNAESIVTTTAKFLLIANGELDTARRLCEELVELARPRGWLIALAHGSFMRAIALLHLGRVHEAHADARLSFDFKKGNSPPVALVWSLFPLVEALTELDELEAAEAALDEGRQLGDFPPACLSSTLLLERRAHLRLAQCRYDEAHADLLLAADWWRRLRVQHPGVATWRVDDCEALVALGDSGSARTLALEQLELAERPACPNRAEPRCGDSPAPPSPPTPCGCWSRPWGCSTPARRDWSSPGPWSTWVRCCAGPTSAQPPANRFARGSTSPSGAAWSASPIGPASSSERAAPVRAGAPSPASSRSLPPSARWPISPRPATATGRSPSGCTSPAVRWRPT